MSRTVRLSYESAYRSRPKMLNSTDTGEENAWRVLTLKSVRRDLKGSSANNARTSLAASARNFAASDMEYLSLMSNRSTLRSGGPLSNNVESDRPESPDVRSIADRGSTSTCHNGSNAFWRSRFFIARRTGPLCHGKRTDS